LNAFIDNVVTLTCNSIDGSVELVDGSVLKVAVSIIDARGGGFSVFGGVNILVKHTGGIAVTKIGAKASEMVKDKPLFPASEQPTDGWQIVDVVKFTPATSETKVETTKGVFLVTLKAIPSMAAVNLNYKNELNEPAYVVNWAPIVSWKRAV
jgi:hypothetical protein